MPLINVPLIEATDDSVRGYGCLVDDPDAFAIEIVRWPVQGWRQLDEGTGIDGGSVEGVFRVAWDGDVLMGHNEAVDGRFVMDWSRDPQLARTGTGTAARRQVLLWNLNYHPDGGQLFYPIDKSPFSRSGIPSGFSIGRDACTGASVATSAPNSMLIYACRCRNRREATSGIG